ncbi:MAG: hypothetical protein GY719_15790 [bacterium]|nr:hypothetical protein [bacterium]
MKKVLLSLLFLLLIAGLAALGPDTPAQDPVPEAETETPRAAAAEPPEEPAVEDLTQEELETFVPTEKLTADSVISFPVDI